MPIPLLSKVHGLQNIGNVCAYSSTGHSELLGTENANICKGSVSSTCMLDNDLEFREIACFFFLATNSSLIYTEVGTASFSTRALGCF